MTSARPLRVFVLDDEPLAVQRLVRLLKDIDGVDVAGTATDAVRAVNEIRAASVDVLFLDIEMPGLSGFEVIERLEAPPLVIFTTAFDQYALQAFETSSIDYLVKPIARDRLERALAKASRFVGGTSPQTGGLDVGRTLEAIRAALQGRPAYPERIGSTIGGRTQLVELSRVTHFYASDKQTFAAVDPRPVPIDSTLNELESRLDPGRFVRVHRAALVNVACVREVKSTARGLSLRLTDAAQTEIPVARERQKAVKSRFGI